MESRSVSRASLIEVYISGLGLAEVAIIVGTDGRCRIETDGEIAPGEKIRRQFFFKPSHADLVSMTIDKEGLPGKSPAALAAQIERTAAMLGAPHRSPGELRRAAAEAVAEVQARVAAMRQNGGLQDVNRQYRAYRMAQVAKAEKAIPYSAFLRRFTASLVRDVAARI
jgi:hypothetical protein